MMQPSWFSRLGLVAALSLAWPSGAGAQSTLEARGGGVQDVRARFADPAFRYAGGDLERVALRDAIRRAVEPMSFIARPIARGRLSDRNPVYASIGFRFPEGAIVADMAGRPSLRSRADGTPEATRAVTGEPVQLSQRFEGGRLVQQMTTREGSRRNEYTVSPNGRRMTMRVTVHARQLRAPLRYELSYAR